MRLVMQQYLLGPLYLWRNVVNKTEWTPGGDKGRFIKMGYAGGENWMTGHMYIFNNTCFQTGADGVIEGIGGGNRIVKHAQSRNNIIHLLDISSQSISPIGIDNSFDYDLFNGSVPAGSEAHGIKGIPTYVKGAGYNQTKKTGNFQLSTNSLGYNSGVVIPISQMVISVKRRIWVLTKMVGKILNMG